MALKLSKKSPSSPPDPQGPLTAMGCRMTQESGSWAAHTEALPNLFAKSRTYLQTPPDTWDFPNWDVLWFPCKVPWLETSCAPTAMKKEGCWAQGDEAVCPSSAAGSQLALQGLSSSVFTTSVLYGPHTVVKS